MAQFFNDEQPDVDVSPLWRAGSSGQRLGNRQKVEVTERRQHAPVRPSARDLVHMIHLDLDSLYRVSAAVDYRADQARCVRLVFLGPAIWSDRTPPCFEDVCYTRRATTGS